MSTSKIESAFQNYSSCELPAPMLNDTFQQSSLNTTITAAATATTIPHTAVFQQQDTNALKLQFKTKEQTWNKDKAILEQKIELLESHIYESRIRQENLQKMNEAFMTALHDLTENPKNFSNKMLKELQQLFDGKKGCTEHEQQLLKNATTIKSQRIELDELRARVTELEDELAEKAATHEADCENLRQFCQSEIQSMHIQQAAAIEEATKEQESSGNEVIRLKNVIEAMTANHKMEVEMLQSSRGSQMEEDMKGRIEESMALNSCNSRFSDDKSLQQLNQSWQEKLQQQQQQFLQQQYQLQQQLQQQQQQQQQYVKMIDSLQKEKTQLGGQLQSVATQLQSSQDQNSVMSQALNSSQGQLEELKQKMNTHTSPSFPNTCSEFFDAELQISRIEPDRVKRRSIMNESLLSSFMPGNTPVNNNNNAKMFPLHNASSNENFSNSTNSSGKNYTQIPGNNGISNNMISSFNQSEQGSKHNYPLQQQEMHISDLNPSKQTNNNNNMNFNNQQPNNSTANNVNNNGHPVHGVMIRQGSMSGSEMSNCDTFGYPSGVKNTNNYLRGQSNSSHKSPNEFTTNLQGNNTTKGQLQYNDLQQDNYENLTNIQQQQLQQQRLMQQAHLKQIQQKQQQNQQMTHLQQQQQQQQQQLRQEQEYQLYQDQKQSQQNLIQQNQLQQQQYLQQGQQNSLQQVPNTSQQLTQQQYQNILKESQTDKRSIQSQLQQLQQQSQQQYQQSQNFSKRSSNINNFNSGDRQIPNQNLKTEDATTRRPSNSISSHGQGSLSCTNLQSIGQITDNRQNNNNNISNNQGNNNNNSNNDNCSTHSSNSSQSQVLQKISRNGVSTHSSSSSILNQQKLNGNNMPNSKNQLSLNGPSLKQQSIRNSSCNNPQKTATIGQENYPQPYVRQSNTQFISSKQLSYPKSCSHIETTQTNTANSHVFEQGILSNIHTSTNAGGNNLNNNNILETQLNQSIRNSSINKNVNRDSNVLSQSMVSGVSQSLVSQSMMIGNGNISQSVSMGRANHNTNNNPMSQSSLLNQDQSFLVRAINENMNERMSLEEKMKNLESEVNNYVALAHPKTKSSSSLPDQLLVQQVMKELYAKQLSRNIFQLAKEEREAVLRAEIKILVDKVLMNKQPLRQHSHDSHNSILNHSLNKSIISAAEDNHLHGGLRESRSPRYNSNTSSVSGSLLHSTILSAKANSSAALKPNSNIFGKIQIKPTSATHFQQQLEGLQGQHFFDKKIRQPLAASSVNSRN